MCLHVPLIVMHYEKETVWTDMQMSDKLKEKKQAKILVVCPQHQCTSACILQVFEPLKG